jgi:hypothetical protein
MANTIVLWLALVGALVTALDVSSDVRCPDAESAGALSGADQASDSEDSSLLPSANLSLPILQTRVRVMSHGALQDRTPPPPPIRPPIA